MLSSYRPPGPSRTPGPLLAIERSRATAALEIMLEISSGPSTVTVDVAVEGVAWRGVLVCVSKARSSDRELALFSRLFSQPRAFHSCYEKPKDES